MKNKNLIIIAIVIVIIGVAFAIFNKDTIFKSSKNLTLDNLGTTNPASEYCIEAGGTLEMQTSNDGSQFGNCKKDGKVCEEWALFRGECNLPNLKPTTSDDLLRPQFNQLHQNITKTANPASEYCIAVGGTLEMQTSENGSQFGNCKKDGKVCEEWALFRGECNLPNTPTIEKGGRTIKYPENNATVEIKGLPTQLSPSASQTDLIRNVKAYNKTN